MRWGGGLALSAALLAVLAAGMWLGGHPGQMPPVLRDLFVDSAARLSAEASEAIRDNYYRPVPQGELTESSLRGMVRELRRRYRDRFSDYFSSEMLKRFDEAIAGRFSGVGLSVTGVRRGLRVARVFKRSPAAKAGIKPGDLIVSVDGRSIAGESSDAAAARVRGPEGTGVVLGVVRPPSHEVRRLRLTRSRIELPAVHGELKAAGGRRLGHVRFVSFSEGAHAALRRAVRKLEREGARGLVLDLRGNSGGLLEEAVLSASVFLPKGEVVVSTDSRTQGHTVYRTAAGALPPLPTVVLIDRGTASAAEILTAALADDAGATVVGARSFGKGVFQQEIGLSNGGALKLTVGEYFTPGGANLAGRGIKPDVAVRDLPMTRRDEALERALGVLATAR